MNTPQIAVEPVTDEDWSAAMSFDAAGVTIREILEQDRRRVAERQAAEFAFHYAYRYPDGLIRYTCGPVNGMQPSESIPLYERPQGAEIERLRAEVARLTAALNGKENSDA